MTRPAIDLPSFFNGINRRIGEQYGRPRGEAVASLNVETALGEVQRRRALRSFSSGPPLRRPPGSWYATSVGTEGEYADPESGQGGFSFEWDLVTTNGPGGPPELDPATATELQQDVSGGTNSGFGSSQAAVELTGPFSISFQFETTTSFGSVAVGIATPPTWAPNSPQDLRTRCEALLGMYDAGWFSDPGNRFYSYEGTTTRTGPLASGLAWDSSTVVTVELDASGVFTARVGTTTLFSSSGHTDSSYLLVFGFLQGGTTNRVYNIEGLIGFGPGQGRLFFGAHSVSPEQFTGLWWDHFTLSGGPATSSQKIAVDYYDGTDWVEIPWVLDLTTTVQNGHLQPLTQRGAILWRLVDIEDDWSQVSVGGVTSYWVRIRIVDLVTEEEGSFAYGYTISGVGITVVDLAPVNGLFEGTPGNAEALIVAADRPNRRGQELGGNVGIADVGGSTKVTYFELAEEAGWEGAPSINTWAGGTEALSGTDGSIRKLREEIFSAEQNAYVPYEWLTDQWSPGFILQDETAPSSDATSVVNLFNSSKLGSVADNEFEHCRVQVNNDVNLGAGERRVITHNPVAFIGYVFPDFSASPDPNETFDLIPPPYQVVLWDTDPIERPSVQSNSAHELVLEDPDLQYSEGFTSGYKGRFSIVREMRWEHRRGQRWVFAFNAVTRRVLATNGNEILETDGRVFRRLSSVNEGDQADILAAEIPEGLPGSYSEIPNASRSFFRPAPPKADFLAVYRSRVFAAKGDLVYWTFPNQGIDVWPYLFSLRIRGQESADITGMRVVGDRLVVFTRFDTYELIEVEPHTFASRPISQIGFVHQNATCVIANQGTSFLAGVTPNGVGIWTGGEVQMVLNDWDDVLDEPISASRLERSSAAYVSSTAQAFFAVPVGDDAYPSRILVREIENQRWWLWSTSWGVSEMARGTDQSGRDFLLVGYETGFVARLADDLLDDNEGITGSVTTAPAVVPGGARVAVTSSLTTARVMGTDTADIKLFGDSSPTALKNVSGIRFPGGGFQVGDSELGTSTGRPIGGVEFRTQEHRCRGTRVSHTVQMSFSSAGRWILRALQAVFLPKTTRGRR